jgi:hypothetical protein
LSQGSPHTRRVSRARPVTTRRSEPASPHTFGNTRRQRYITLDTPGAEIRLPALPTFQFGWRLVSGVIAILAAGMLWALWNSPVFQVQEPVLRGVERLTAEDVAATVPLAGLPAIEVRPEKIQTDLQAVFPELVDLKVSLTLPATLVINAAERQPVILWKQDGEERWVDREGFLFPIRGSVDTPLVIVEAQGDLPELPVPGLPIAAQPAAEDGDNPEQPADPQPYITPGLATAILTLGPQVPSETAVVYDPGYGLGWNDPEGWQVYFGTDIQDMTMKLTEYQAIVDYLTRIGQRPTLISVESVHAPFYRLEQ